MPTILDSLLAPPPGVGAELTAMRSATSKAWDAGGGRVALRITTIPLHFFDGAAWQECNPTWQAGQITTLPFQVAFAPTGIGFAYTPRAGGATTTVRLLSIGGVTLSALLPAPTVAVDTLTWSPVTGVTLSIIARPWGIRIVKQLDSALAPKVFLWEVTGPSTNPLPMLSPAGSDNLNRLPDGRTFPFRRRLEVSTTTVVISDDGTTRVAQVTDAWTGNALIRDINGNLVPDANVIFPVTFDPSFSESITVGADDGHEYGGDPPIFWSSAGIEYDTVGRTDATHVDNAGLRFIGVTVPQGATVSAATLTWSVTSVYGLPVATNTYGDGVDNSAALSSSHRPSSGWSKTTNVTAYSVAAAGTKVVTITDIVQEVLNRAGWASGNAMSFAVYHNVPSGNHTFGIDDVENTGAHPSAKLDITYTAGGGAGVDIGITDFGRRFNPGAGLVLPGFGPRMPGFRQGFQPGILFGVAEEEFWAVQTPDPPDPNVTVHA